MPACLNARMTDKLFIYQEVLIRNNKFTELDVYKDPFTRAIKIVAFRISMRFFNFNFWREKAQGNYINICTSFGALT